MDKSASSPSLEALLSDPSFFEEIPLEVPNEGAFSSLGDLFDGEEVKKARDLMKDVTSFKVDVFVSAYFLLFFRLSYAYCLVLFFAQMSVFGIYMVRYRVSR